ncbi:MAG: cbb3-type cytochrome c oxidase subunit 3 [Sterolibacteriaceae bacterium]|uniref:Cbb3-type cytochrome c oxidase subunit 3 n=1 Tax=Candidatus Methylophosphatis roskildensis TaxID=2899263 RepID=A0A9D7E2S1_9PROT|nr:cbb3-type cytochrome c oxidase subunit 3 [Candidatus Methylophosphatis roskildensis]MBK7235492.1 cbb3-type cytochrome c oxidase subunit 3 [Sterolibacteriaceae bacterium]MBK7663385.1 cbb3-type cytochrome c oxidase subunit 3 [Sterolibacteriaceae bacterium]MBK9083725.1 cbb3-type cytochrome c oxidase subunit 3 [Sterolibacteriaceae bacterium]
MDINDARSILTVLCFASFIGIALWAYSGRNKARFDEAANLPFAEDELPASRAGSETTQGKAS